MKILGYENITVLKRFEAEPGTTIILYKESEESKTAYPFGILFERQYKGKANYD